MFGLLAKVGNNWTGILVLKQRYLKSKCNDRDFRCLPVETLR